MRNLLVAGMVGLLTGCSAGAADDTGPKPKGPCGDVPTWGYKKSAGFRHIKTVERHKFTVVLTTQSKVNELCQAPPGINYNGCQATDPDTGGAYIVAVRPRDFNDRARLCVVGHEVMHALGAKHE